MPSKSLGLDKLPIESGRASKHTDDEWLQIDEAIKSGRKAQAIFDLLRAERGEDYYPSKEALVGALSYWRKKQKR